MGLIVDFLDLQVVCSMVVEVCSQLFEFDVLINNVGVFNSSVVINEQGFDLCYVVNYFVFFVLMQELLFLLK